MRTKQKDPVPMINASPSKGLSEKPMKVKLDDFTAGIGTVFSGVLQILRSIDTETAKNLIAAAGLGDTAVDASDSVGTACADAVTDNSSETDPAGTEEAVEAEAKSEAAAPEEQEVTPGITQDDITKIIVKKLKKDRSNNEKIGAILKTYGAAKVSELATEQYEAFLTDLGAL